MDISLMDTSAVGIARLSTALSTNKLQEATDVAVLKKSLDLQEQAALQLIQSIPSPLQGLPDHVGRNLNVTA